MLIKKKKKKKKKLVNKWILLFLQTSEWKFFKSEKIDKYLVLLES